MITTKKAAKPKGRKVWMCLRRSSMRSDRLYLAGDGMFPRFYESKKSVTGDAFYRKGDILVPAQIPKDIPLRNDS